MGLLSLGFRMNKRRGRRESPSRVEHHGSPAPKVLSVPRTDVGVEQGGVGQLPHGRGDILARTYNNTRTVSLSIYHIHLGICRAVVFFAAPQWCTFSKGIELSRT